MSLNLSGLIHELALKQFIEKVVIAVKQLEQEGVQIAVQAAPAAAPVIALGGAVADGALDAVLARVKHLEEKQSEALAAPVVGA